MAKIVKVCSLTVVAPAAAALGAAAAASGMAAVASVADKGCFDLIGKTVLVMYMIKYGEFLPCAVFMQGRPRQITALEFDS